MGDRLVKKGLVVGIILLFIGVGVYPAIAVKLNTSINTVQDQKSNANAKDYLFKTIIEIANNKEIKNIIQKSQNGESQIIFLQEPCLILFLIKLRTRFGLLLPTTSVLTKSYLEYAYNMGVRLSKSYDVSKMHSMLERFKVRNQEIQKEITLVIEKNSDLNKKIEQLPDLPCNCEKNNTTDWYPPTICLFLSYLFVILWAFKNPLAGLIYYYMELLNCPIY